MEQSEEDEELDELEAATGGATAVGEGAGLATAAGEGAGDEAGELGEGGGGEDPGVDGAGGGDEPGGDDADAGEGGGIAPALHPCNGTTHGLFVHEPSTASHMSCVQ